MRATVSTAPELTSAKATAVETPRPTNIQPYTLRRKDVTRSAVAVAVGEKAA